VDDWFDGFLLDDSRKHDSEKVNASVGAIILAAGLGERLKAVGLKPFLLHQGKCFLQYAVENATSIALNPLVIVTNNLFYESIIGFHFPAKILINPHPENGMLSSILVGLREVESSCSGFFLCPIDYPLIQQTTYQKLLLAQYANQEKIIQPTYNSRPGHPIVFPKILFHALWQCPPDQGARFIMRQFASFREPIAVDDAGILININTPALYYQHCK
jgi:molybdenum cofactor cytidylyltransferase